MCVILLINSYTGQYISTIIGPKCHVVTNCQQVSLEATTSLLLRHISPGLMCERECIYGYSIPLVLYVQALWSNKRLLTLYIRLIIRIIQILDVLYISNTSIAFKTKSVLQYKKFILFLYGNSGFTKNSLVEHKNNFCCPYKAVATSFAGLGFTLSSNPSVTTLHSPHTPLGYGYKSYRLWKWRTKSARFKVNMLIRQ